MIKNFYGSILFTVACLALGGWYGFASGGGVGPMLATLWICVVLSVLEVSLSFDNAVVNASVLKTMDEKWQRAFLTWGILIAVFGMRVVFPVAIVAIAAQLDPVRAIVLALDDPQRYQEIIEGAHAGIMGFGGAFLALVGMKFFFDSDKEHHWIEVLERPLQRFASLEAFEIVVVLLCLFGVSRLMPDTAEAQTYLIAGILGIATFFAVEWLGNVLEAPAAADGVQKAGLGAFLYLEVLDASFSFDGVIGAFALSNNLVVIAVGLGIGAMFVRSLTVLLVRKGTLAEYRYLEHGAFWAILALAAVMLTSVVWHLPETVTGLIGAVLIGLSFWSSLRANRDGGGAPADATA